MPMDLKPVTPNADVKFLKRNEKTGTYSWDHGE